MDAERPVDLYEFLVEAELQQYYTSIKNELKITAVSQIKYATDEDFRSLNFSRPEIRRIRKYYEKYFNLSYLSKIKRLLQNPRRDELLTHSTAIDVLAKVPSSPNKSISVNKHIIPLDSISVNKQLGVGEFGIVQQGVWTNGNDRIQVAIKCLCRERMQSNPMEFLKEAAIMHSIEHENIVRLYGVVLSTDSLMLVTELAHLRSLLECLKDSDLRVKFLTVSVLCDFAIQICNGMLYLESNRLIHRDLAARNILVFNKDKVKISDFGLSRALGVGKDYYKTNFNVNLKLPIAWCAPECVNYLKFTNSSDVWAFAVCLWEMFSYGFQPWVAMTGHQILEAIDKPNFQRLEQPECCSKEYYALMLKCWNHDPVKRPKFSEIYQILPDMKPEQLKTVMQLSEVKKDHLAYRQGDIITVLDRSANSPYWRGVLNCGQVGLFNPANTVAYIESLPSSTSNRDSFVRSTMERTSKRKLKTEMISSPQNDLKHTGHVGIDGAYFGNVAFLSNSQTYNNTLPRQVVTPYKPSEDLEQTPLLLPPTPTSPDSTQTGSAYFSDASNLIMNASTSTQHTTDGLPFKFQHNNASKERHNGSDANLFNESNPFAHSEHQLLTHQTQPFVVGDNFVNLSDKKLWETQESHEYHEISDDEQGDKVFDFGTSLLDEMDFMFRSMSSTNGDSLGPPPLTPNFDNVNKRNELAELKLNRKNSGAGTSNGGTTSYKSKKKPTTMKAISVKDEKILNHAIEIANKMSATSMTDLDQNSNQSPRRKFSFRFPNLSSNHDKDNPGAQMMSGTSTLTHQNNSSKERRNFSEDVKNVPDLQSTITEEHRLAYKCLVEDNKEMLFMAPSPQQDVSEVFNSTISGGISTLPRPTVSNADHTPNVENKAATLSKLLKRSKNSNDEASSSSSTSHNPLRLLRDKSFPLARPRLKILPSVGSESVNSQTFLLDNDCETMGCESPSYLINPECNFSIRDMNIAHDNTPKPMSISKQIDGLQNALPLPPKKDRTSLQLNTTQKRHVRKYPLIIPGNGIQRTLDKVNQITPVEEKLDVFPIPPQETLTISSEVNLDDDDDDDVFEELKNDTKLFEDNVDLGSLQGCEKIYTKDFIENNFPTPGTSSNISKMEFDGLRTYENLEAFQNRYSQFNGDDADTASLHFESILENDDNIKAIGPISDDMVDGFCMFEDSSSSRAVASGSLTAKPAPIKKPERKSLIKNQIVTNIEVKRQEFSQKYPKYKMPRNELASNALFNKIKESVEMAAEEPEAEEEEEEDSEANRENGSGNDCDLKKSINHVSCEDLLDFSEKKPMGKERGVESDEVRIMAKVLGQKVTLERCLQTLDFISWDLQKAIKLCKLQNLLPNQSLDECLENLDANDWDINQIITK